MKLRVKILDIVVLGILGIFSSFTCLKSEPLREKKGDIRYFEESEIDKKDYNPSGEVIDEEETTNGRVSGYEGNTPSRKARRVGKVQTGSSGKGSGKRSK